MDYAGLVVMKRWFRPAVPAFLCHCGVFMRCLQGICRGACGTVARCCSAVFGVFLAVTTLVWAVPHVGRASCGTRYWGDFWGVPLPFFTIVPWSVN